MILQLRQGRTMYELEVPHGCRLEPATSGPPVLVIPGGNSDDTSIWLPAPMIVAAARIGQFGLSLRSSSGLPLRSAG